ncbi:MAG: hypothetical protein ACOCTT_00820 [archaeon]
MAGKRHKRKKRQKKEDYEEKVENIEKRIKLLERELGIEKIHPKLEKKEPSSFQRYLWHKEEKMKREDKKPREIRDEIEKEKHWRNKMKKENKLLRRKHPELTKKMDMSEVKKGELYSELRGLRLGDKEIKETLRNNLSKRESIDKIVKNKKSEKLEKGINALKRKKSEIEELSNKLIENRGKNKEETEKMKKIIQSRLMEFGLIEQKIRMLINPGKTKEEKRKFLDVDIKDPFSKEK